MSPEEKLVLSTAVTNSGSEVVQILAKWLGVEDVWLAHVLESSGECDCGLNQEMGDYYCKYWQAVEDKRRADQRLSFEARARELQLQEAQDREARAKEMSEAARYLP